MIIVRMRIGGFTACTYECLHRAARIAPWLWPFPGAPPAYRSPDCGSGRPWWRHPSNSILAAVLRRGSPAGRPTASKSGRIRTSPPRRTLSRLLSENSIQTIETRLRLRMQRGEIYAKHHLRRFMYLLINYSRDMTYASKISLLFNLSKQ